MRHRPLITTSFALLALAGACTSGDSSTTDDPAAAGTSTVDTGPVQGVNDSEIVVGFAMIDVQQLLDDFNVDLGVYPIEDFVQALAEGVNDRGGINGRDVRVYMSTFSPVDNASMDRACVELVQDDQAFVVMGAFTNDQSLCVTETHGLPYVGAFGETPQIQARSDGRFFAAEIDFTRYTLAAVQQMIDDGDLEGHDVGLYFDDNAPDREVTDQVQSLLDEAGVSVVSRAAGGSINDDPVTGDAAVDTALERLRADGADLVLTPSEPIAMLRALERRGWDVEVASTNSSLLNLTPQEFAVSDEVLERTTVVTVDTPSTEEALEDEGVQQCITDYDAAHPGSPLDLDDDKIVGSATTICRTFALTVQILEAAGDDPTVSSFVDGGESLGDIDLPASPAASLGPDKHSAGSAIRRYAYDPAEGTWARRGDPIVVSN